MYKNLGHHVKSKTVFSLRSKFFKTISMLLFDFVTSDKLHKFSRVKQIERIYIMSKVNLSNISNRYSLFAPPIN